MGFPWCQIEAVQSQIGLLFLFSHGLFPVVSYVSEEMLGIQFRDRYVNQPQHWTHWQVKWITVMLQCIVLLENQVDILCSMSHSFLNSFCGGRAHCPAGDQVSLFYDSVWVGVCQVASTWIPGQVITAEHCIVVRWSMLFTGTVCGFNVVGDRVISHGHILLIINVALKTQWDLKNYNGCGTLCRTSAESQLFFFYLYRPQGIECSFWFFFKSHHS